MIKKILTLLAFLLLTVSVSYAQVGVTSVPFLQIEPDSRASGMGNTGVAIADNASAIFWNPAGLGFQQGNQVNITHSQWLPQFNADLFYDYLVGKYEVEDIGTFGAHFTYLNLGEQLRTGPNYDPELDNNLGRFNSYEMAFGVSFGHKLNENWSLGTGVRYIYSSLADSYGNEQQGKIDPGSSFGIDLATLYKSNKFNFLDRDASFSAGLNISNIGPGMKYTENAKKDPLPTMFRIGWAFKTNLDHKGINTLTFANDISKVMARSDSTGYEGSVKALFSSWDSYEKQIGGGRMATLSLAEQLMISTGIEYWYNNLFALRGGYYYEDPNNGDRQFMTLGAGLRYDFIGIDFSYIYTLGDEEHPLANTTRFGLILNF